MILCLYFIYAGYITCICTDALMCIVVIIVFLITANIHNSKCRWHNITLAMFETNPTWPNFDFDQLFMWIRANNEQIWFPRGQKSDFEQCLNRLLVNFLSISMTRKQIINGGDIRPKGLLSYELGQNIYFLEARWVILKQLKLYLIALLVNFSCELEHIMIIYVFLCAGWLILSNVWTDSNLS